MHITAAITAGGKSRRFGSDKALYRVGQYTLLEIAAHNLHACNQRLIIGPYALKGWQTYPDPFPGVGPISGLVSALQHAQNGWVFFTGVDMPQLDAHYWSHLHHHLNPDVQVIVPLNEEGKMEALAAAYHVSALPHLQAALQEQRYGLRQVIERKLLHHTLSGVPQHHFKNVNTRQDTTDLIDG
ncbi:molybdenum cofactor guanylyltransferase [Deinococcus roseus]|uniref:Molybdenum cofactor guanylyltransferase n=1 Tax=Deinococcus roseus TaxID=392414 RepID=A0ABQ2D0X7_9DEIO|nr:molybdenum cofactor guanylyltransferase [Deinococcus roseus]GGJ39925.1 putative molybdenum cofactor guanylyltransferase [Deinococcus roseus]